MNDNALSEYLEGLAHTALSATSVAIFIVGFGYFLSFL